MSNCLRWIKEFVSPKIKCKRLGHKSIYRKLKIRNKTSYFYSCAAADWYYYFEECPRCGKELDKEPTFREHIDDYSSCSMPTSMWDDIRSKGYVELKDCGYVNEPQPKSFLQKMDDKGNYERYTKLADNI